MSKDTIKERSSFGNLKLKTYINLRSMQNIYYGTNV